MNATPNNPEKRRPSKGFAISLTASGSLNVGMGVGVFAAKAGHMPFFDAAVTGATAGAAALTIGIAALAFLMTGKAITSN
ncbi:hypothetical protein [Streptomyces sp. NPDC002187]|uniref:hypothetical protein n=1 Tax=Streptomyces sp. NPDC002187 TaxID=3364637 RepID=UPI003693C9C8